LFSHLKSLKRLGEDFYKIAAKVGIIMLITPRIIDYSKNFKLHIIVIQGLIKKPV